MMKQKIVRVVGYDTLPPSEKRKASGILRALRKAGYRTNIVRNTDTIKRRRSRGQRP